MKINNLPAFPTRSEKAHKGFFKTIYVVGGQPYMVGAASLTARAALRTGAGLVKFLADEFIISELLLLEPSATAIALQERSQNLELILNEYDDNETGVLAIGPGMGVDLLAEARMVSLLNDKRAMVLDADALTLLAMSGQILEPVTKPRVLTPHPGEYRRLAVPLEITLDPTCDEQRVQAAQTMATRHNSVVVLKGHRTIVADSSQSYVNHTGNAAMATAGSGDVLTGAISSLIAQGLDGFEAACLGVYLHGLAGDLWVKQNGPVGILARELADLIPLAIKTMIDD